MHYLISGRRLHTAVRVPVVQLHDQNFYFLFLCNFRKSIVNSSVLGRDVHFFDVIHPTFPPPVEESPTVQDTLKDDIGKAIMFHAMPKLCEYPSLDSCKKTFMWAHKEVDVASHPVVGLILQVGDAKKFPQTLGLESVDLKCKRDKNDVSYSKRRLYTVKTSLQC